MRKCTAVFAEEMAKKAVDCGVAGILVSNNGTQKLKGIRPAVRIQQTTFEKVDLLVSFALLFFIFYLTFTDWLSARSCSGGEWEVRSLFGWRDTFWFGRSESVGSGRQGGFSRKTSYLGLGMRCKNFFNRFCFVFNKFILNVLLQGEDSVRNMLLMMKDEFITTMQLMGIKYFCYYERLLARHLKPSSYCYRLPIYNDAPRWWIHWSY